MVVYTVENTIIPAECDLVIFSCGNDYVDSREGHEDKEKYGVD